MKTGWRDPSESTRYLCEHLKGVHEVMGYLAACMGKSFVMLKR